jgi:single-strand DNA-binding protein
MASGYQRMTVVGNLGAKPELRTTESGKKVATFSIAVNEQKDADPTWFTCKAWEKSAETLMEYADKGTQLIVDARYTPRKYTPEGAEKAITVPEFTVMSFRFLGSAESRSGSGSGNGNAPTPITQAKSGRGKATPTPDTVEADSDDELPF